MCPKALPAWERARSFRRRSGILATDEHSPGPADEPRNAAVRAAMFLATGFGSGYSPVAPGTAGTIVAMPLGWLMLGTLGGHPLMELVTVAAVSALAIWSAELAAPAFGLKDPGQIVVDEIAGFLVSVLFLPAGWTTLVTAFVLFRVFDVVKPPPCRRLERLPGGLGIVADDLAAGVYANISAKILCSSGILSL